MYWNSIHNYFVKKLDFVSLWKLQIIPVFSKMLSYLNVLLCNSLFKFCLKFYSDALFKSPIITTYLNLNVSINLLKIWVSHSAIQFKIKHLSLL